MKVEQIGSEKYPKCVEAGYSQISIALPVSLEPVHDRCMYEKHFDLDAWKRASQRGWRAQK